VPVLLAVLGLALVGVIVLVILVSFGILGS